MKDILIVAHFTSDNQKEHVDRFGYIANLLSDSKNKVELVTSSFSHTKKRQRDLSLKSGVENYKVTYFFEPSYNKNVSLKRFYSHYIFANNLKNYLKGRKKPDVIYSSVPSLDVAYVVAKYAKKNNIKFIVDVQDLWPEAFKMVFNIPVISDIIFAPMVKKANSIYKMADEIVAVSQTYADRVLKVNDKVNIGYSIFLGTELKKVDEIILNKNIQKPQNEIWLGYIGTLGHSYDLTCVIDALKVLKDRKINNIKFIVMGDGPLKEKFESYAKECEVNAEFTGRLSYDKMIHKLSICDIAVNPIKSGSAGSIINKVGDYAAVGLPVINTQECQEYRNLVEKYKIGFNCENGNPIDLADKLLILYKDENLIKSMGKNNRRLAEEKFDRGSTYKEIEKIIMGE